MNSEYLNSESTNENQITQLSINKSIFYSNNQKAFMSPLVKMSPLITQNTSMKYNPNYNQETSQIQKERWSTIQKSFNPFNFSKTNFDKIPKIEIPNNKTNDEDNTINFSHRNFFKSGYLQNEKFQIGKINSFLFSDFKNNSEKKEKENFLSPIKNYFSIPQKKEKIFGVKRIKIINNFDKVIKGKKKDENERKILKEKKLKKEEEKLKFEKEDLKKEKRKLKHLLKLNEENNIITENGVEYIHFLQRKRKLKEKNLELKKKKPKTKKLKKLDKTKINIQLNQIEIKGISLIKFPAINNIKSEDLSVNLLVRMLVEENYFNIVNKFISDIPPIEEKINKQVSINKFKRLKNKISELYLIEENNNENNPINMIKNYYHQIKETVLLIQKNFVGKKKAIYNINQCLILEKLIKSCNLITNTLTDYKKIGKKYKNTIQIIKTKNLLEIKKNNHYKVYICEICNKSFSNGQGLGGHMSRNHPNQSEKYKEKLLIRKKRINDRKRLFNIKKILFDKYNLNYEFLVNNHEKVKIRKFLISHKDEYRKLKSKLKESDV